jgi:hypothetical protein
MSGEFAQFHSLCVSGKYTQCKSVQRFLSCSVFDESKKLPSTYLTKVDSFVQCMYSAKEQFLSMYSAKTAKEIPEIFLQQLAASFKGTVESLQSHMIFTMSHWSSGLTCLLLATRVTGSNPRGGTYVKPGFSC